MTEPQTINVAAPDRVTDRLPIFSALHVLGLSYAEIGRLLGVSTVTVHHWAVGKKPLPLVRFLALQFLVGRLVGIIGAKYPPRTRYARREEIARNAAESYMLLARDELERRRVAPLDVLEHEQVRPRRARRLHEVEVGERDLVGHQGRAP